MTQADPGGLGMSMVSSRKNRNSSHRTVPVVRLKDEADLKKIYKLERKLGQGNFGVVYEATHIETQAKWAIKKVYRPVAGSRKCKMMGHEINILRQVNHKHIIHLQEVYETAKMTYLVTELCTGGELKQLLQRKNFFTEDETRHIICSLADAVVYLHKRDIIHRDLKLENILVKNSPDEDDDGRINIKVSDFGLSVQTNGAGIDNVMTDKCGTLTYMAPEVMSGRSYSELCDVWSIGIVMYVLLCGEFPFVSKTKEHLLEEITNNEVKFTQSIWTTVSDAAKNLLTYLLKVDPAYRISASQLLVNPWITGDTNMPAAPSNVLLMMRQYMEQEEGTESPKDSSLISAEDAVDGAAVPDAALTESSRSHAELSPERDSSLCKPSTSSMPTADNSHSHQQNQHKNETPRTPQHNTAKSHAALKPPKPPSAKQRMPRNKESVNTGKKTM